MPRDRGGQRRNQEPERAEGHMDVPRAGSVIERGVFTVEGWASFPSGPTGRVEVWLGGESLGLAQLGIPRPDVRGHSDRPDAILSGFSLTCDIEHWSGPNGETEVKAVPVSVAGEELDLPPSTVVVAPASPLAPPPAPDPTPRPRRGTRTLVCTHQLCLGGASRYLLELLRELLRIEAIDPVIFSPIGGPLQPQLEALGVPVHVSGPAPVGDAALHKARVEEVLAWAKPLGFELVLINTASPLTFCAADVAGRLGIPVVWSIHESFEPAVLWDGCDPAVRRRGEEALSRAAAGLFEADATRRIYEPYLEERGITLPYGLDLEPIDAFRASFDRTSARRQLGIPPQADLVLCVGTVDPRKAQATLAQAFDLLAGDHPDARLAIVGAGENADSRALSEWIESSTSAERIELVPTTPEIQCWYGVSDLLVCASRIESLPRAVLEAMAWELPVLATDVFGLPELIDQGTTGWLCEAGDTGALAGALSRVLNTSAAERERVGANARRLVERRHALDAHGKDVAEVMKRVGAGGAVSGRRPSSPPGPSAAAPGSRRG
jgi:glycosyltransferase involved in cell wall biosynthesis